VPLIKILGASLRFSKCACGLLVNLSPLAKNGVLWVNMAENQNCTTSLSKVSNNKLLKNMSIGSGADNGSVEDEKTFQILQSNGLFSERNNNDHENITIIIMPLDTNKLREGF
jgi:hypothetical protein